MTEKQWQNTDNLTPWKPGQSGNPAGRPRKGNAWADVVNEILDAKSVTLTIENEDGKKTKKIIKSTKSIRHAVVFAQVLSALQGNTPAFKELADRTEGRPPKKVEIDPPPEKPLQLTDEVLKMYEITRKKLDILEGKSPEELERLQRLMDAEEVNND